MDPNSNLEQQRRLVADILLAVEAGSPRQRIAQMAARLAELVEALDEWITTGGFLPTAWATTTTKEG